MVKIAIIGVGYWGPNLVRNFKDVPRAEIVALCDRDESRARQIRDRHCPQALVVANYQDLAKVKEVDAVVIATPIQTHFEVASIFLSAKKHVFIEKPLARTSDECQTLIDLADKHKVRLMVGHVFEYNPVVRQIGKMVKAGDLGKLLYVHSQRLNLGRIQKDVNALINFAPHDISILNAWFEAQPVQVSARGFSFLHPGIEDVVFLLLEYPNGVVAHVHLSWIDPRKIRLMTLVGTKKMLVYDDTSPDAKIQIYDKGIDRLDEFLKTPDSFAEFQYKLRSGDLTVPTISFTEPLYDECKHFIECIEQGRPPLTDGPNGLRVVKVLEAAQKSLHADGKPVAVN